MGAGADLSVILSGKNLLGPVLKEAAKQTQDFGKTIDDTHAKGRGFGGMLGGLVDGLGKIGLAGLGAKVAFDAVSGVVSGLTADFMEAEKITAATNAVLESTKGVAGMTADSISDLANSLSKVAPFEDEAIQGAENLLLTFTNIGSDIFPQVTETALNMSQALGQDLKSSAIQLGKALQDPITGATALRRVGVNLSDTQMDLIKGFMATNDLASAQGVILKELETEFGGAARAAGQTFAGKMTILNTQIGNVKETIGAALIPILSDLLEKVMPLVSAFGEWLPTGINDTKAAINRAIGIVKAFVGYLNPSNENDVMRAWFGGDIGPRIDEITRTLRSLADMVKGAVVPVVSAMWAEISRFWQEIEPKLMPAVTNVVNFIATSVQWLAGVWSDHWEQISAVLQGVWSVIQGVVQIAWSIVSGIIKVGLDVLTGDWDGAWTHIKEMFAGIWEGIKKVLGGAVAVIINVLSLAWDVVKAGLTSAWNGITGILSGIMNAIGNMITNKINGWIDQINGLIGAVNGVIGAVGLPTIPTIGHIGGNAMHSGSGNASGSATTNNFNLTVNSGLTSNSIANDFALMRARAGA